jgi:hypothetical protein
MNREIYNQVRQIFADNRSKCTFCGRLHSARLAEQMEARCDYCRSPLFRAVRPERSTATRRALERMPRRVSVKCTIATRPDVCREMTTEDVSITGMRLISAHEMFRGERLRIECSFCDAVGVITYVEEDATNQTRQWHVGIQFLTLYFKQNRGAFLSLEV